MTSTTQRKCLVREPTSDGHYHVSVPHKSTRKLRDAYERHRNALVVGNMEREQSFSWQYCLVALVSYSLFVSDVFRTGVAIKQLAYRTQEPDTHVFFGPYAYVKNHLTTKNATGTSMYWPYKYDTTSIGMRAVAEHLSLDTWSPCLLYKEKCDETKGLALASVFSMIDTLVDSVASRQAPSTSAIERRSRSPSLSTFTLRTSFEWRDRVHHYALPWFFQTPVKRTVQVLHYPPHSTHTTQTLCGDTRMSHRPYSCNQPWTNFRRLHCGNAVMDAACRTSPARVWQRIPKRQAQFARDYPNHTIDFVIMDATQDYQRGSLTYQGTKFSDVVVLTRIRKCTDSASCTTVAVDDNRYQAASLLMNVIDWYACVAILRAAGQVYAWARVLSLIIGTSLARLREPRFRDATLMARIIVTLRTVFLIPSQVVIYGSSVPISCYLVAHLIDSPAVYAAVEAYFTSLMGQMQWSWSDFFQHCAISMRTVWVVGFICHRLVMLSTRSNWSPIHGVPGTAEFSITFIASLTIFAQFRALAFRSTKIYSVYEVVGSIHRTRRQSDVTDSTRSALNNFLSGSSVDLKCLLCGFLGLFGITTIVWLLKKLFPRFVPVRLSLMSSTIAPYSAGTLWPRSRLVVSWYASVVNFDSNAKQRDVKRPDAQPATPSARSTASFQRAQQIYRGLMDVPDKALVVRETTISRMLQRDMQSVDRRSRQIESTVFLINLAGMTDPFTWLQLRVLDGRLVALYEAKATNRCFLLPYVLMMMDVDIPIDWDTLELVAVVNSKDLQWPDLLQCG